VTFRREELAVPLVATIDGDQEDGGAVYGEEGADGVEFGCEDLEDDEGEGELAEGGAHVGAFKGPLGGPDLSEFLGRENHGPRPVKTEVEMLVNVCSEHCSLGFIRLESSPTDVRSRQID